MSTLSHQPTVIHSLYSTASSPLLQNPKSLKLTTHIPYSSITKKNKHSLLLTSCEHKQSTHQGEETLSNRTHRRNFITTITAGLTTQALMASGSPKKEAPTSSSTDHPHQMQKVQEFGSEPRSVTCLIRVLVPKPKRSNKKEKGTYVLAIEGIAIPNDEPVRFDVYVAKPHGEDQVGPNLGEFAGSLVDLARIRVGRSPPKGSLELGITGLLKEIGAQDCDKVVVTLLPRSGEVIVGGVYIKFLPYSDSDSDRD